MSDKICNVLVSIVFIGTIILITILNITKNDDKTSIAERRKLAQFPETNISSIFDGTWSKDFDKYTTDQFVFRDSFRAIKSFIQLRVFNMSDNNNIYESEGNIIKIEYPLNETAIRNSAEKIKNVYSKYLDKKNNVYYSIIPDKNYFSDESKYLKMDYSKLEGIIGNVLNKDITYIDIFDKLNINDYYKTDTHWKQENLENVVNEISSKMNFKNRLTNNYKINNLGEFFGVYYGQFADKFNKDISSDEIKYLTNETIENVTVYNYETKQYSKIYDFDKINSEDKYNIFLSGATPLLTITNKNSKEDKELIVFRDSFGSSIIPLFTEAYSKITVVDIRYISSEILGQYIQFENKDVLFLYSTLVLNSSNILK